MKILVTGYAGFIGKNMVKLLQCDHELSFHEWGEPKPSISGHDLVIHLGANSATTERNVELIMQQNLDFSIWLLHECQFQKVHLQYSSSASVYGRNLDFSESAPVDPQSPYAWTKYLFDRYVLTRIESFKTPVQGFRYFNVYGPGEDHKADQASPHHKFTQQAKNTGVIRLFERSDNYLRDFVPVELVCQIHREFFHVPESGIWNVGTGKPQSFQHVAEQIAQQHQAKIEYVPMPENIARQYQAYTCADLSKMKNTINKYSINISLD